MSFIQILSKNNKYLLITIFLLALFLRLFANFCFPRNEILFNHPLVQKDYGLFDNLISDEFWYGNSALSILHGNGIGTIDLWNFKTEKNVKDFTERPDLLFKQIRGRIYHFNLVPPLYPLFLALCFYFFGINTLSFFIPQVLIGALTCLLIFYLAKELFGQMTAVVSALAFAVYPDLIFWVYHMRTETLFIFLLVLSFYLLIKGGRLGNILMVLIGSASFALACMARNTLVPFTPIVLLWILHCYTGSYIKKFAVFLFSLTIIALIFLPWAVRNQRVFNNFSPMSDEGKASFIETKDRSQYQIKKLSIPELAIKVISENPGSFVKGSARRFVSFWAPFRSENRTVSKIYKSVTWLIIFPMAFWGIFASSAKWKFSGLLILFILYHSTIHTLTLIDIGQVYRYPIQPFLCIFFAFGYFDIKKRLKINANE